MGTGDGWARRYEPLTWSCSGCGVPVADRAAHDDFHARLAPAVPPLPPAEAGDPSLARLEQAARDFRSGTAAAPELRSRAAAGEFAGPPGSELDDGLSLGWRQTRPARSSAGGVVGEAHLQAGDELTRAAIAEAARATTHRRTAPCDVVPLETAAPLDNARRLMVTSHPFVPGEGASASACAHAQADAGGGSSYGRCWLAADRHTQLADVVAVALRHPYKPGAFGECGFEDAAGMTCGFPERQHDRADGPVEAR
jgi:hypothetical protein